MCKNENKISMQYFLFSITEAEEGGEGTPTDAEERRIDSLNLFASVTCDKEVTSVNRVYLTKSRLKEKSGHLCTHTYTTYIYYNTITHIYAHYRDDLVHMYNVYISAIFAKFKQNFRS